MEFQLSSFKSWKMMLWKCFTQYASKFGKLSSGHRTGKCQFSFQSQRKAMPKNAQSESEVAQSYLTLCNPMDCSLPGSSVHGIFQARILEWVAISFSKWKRACLLQISPVMTGLGRGMYFFLSSCSHPQVVRLLIKGISVKHSGRELRFPKAGHYVWTVSI